MKTDRKRKYPSSSGVRVGDAAAQRPDHASDVPLDFPGRATVAAGYIVGERPTLLCRDNFVAVINNQKCTLYDCKEASKICDTDTHSDMVVSCDSYAYSADTDLLFTASYDGIVKIYLMRGDSKDQLQHGLLATLLIAPGGLLCVKASKATGDIVFVYSDSELCSETTTAWLKLDYEALMETEEDFDVQKPIVVHVASTNTGSGVAVAADDGRSNNASAKGVENKKNEVIKRKSSRTSKGKIDISGSGDNNKNLINGVGVVTTAVDGKRVMMDHYNEASITTTVSLIKSGGIQSEGESNELLCKRFVKEVRPICALPSRVDVFATDTNLEAIAFAIGKTAMILNIHMRKIVFFECFASISYISFFTPRTFAVGDSTGRIAIYNIDPTAEAYSTENLVVMCDMPDGQFELNASHFKKILLAFHSSSANPRDLADCKEFHNFKKVAVSLNMLIWHAHGVNCLCFNTDGTMLLSGGEEGVLVIWYLKSGAKKFVTRIGSAIFHIICQIEHGMYILCCEANEILFVDPFALCIRNRVSGVTVPINIGMKANKDVNVLSLPDSAPTRELFACGNANINRAQVCLTVGGEPTIPLIQHWPTNLTESLVNAEHDRDMVIGGNVAIYARSNKLQIYNYIHDREVGSLLLKNVNILSRQDDDFGQDWDLEELFISSDGYVVVTVQSRNVLNKLSETNKGGGGGSNSNILPEFQHEVLSNNRKGLLKFWIKQNNAENGNTMMGNYMEHTKISNPHSHKTTSIRQLNNRYAFLTTSLDSEFKVWHMIRKRILRSDNVFETYRAMDINDSDYQVDITDPNSYMWVCVAVGSYKNMPCFASSISDSGTLLAISHDVVVTFWKVGVEHSAVELVGAIPLSNVDENEDVVEEEQRIDGEELHGHGGYRLLTFLFPSQPRRILYSKRTQLCILDVAKGTILWSYPIAAGQVIDKIVYSPQLPNLVVVASSTIDETTYACSGTLEMFWLKHNSSSELTVERFYRGHREISRVVLNMCLTPAAIGYTRKHKRSDIAVEPVAPIFTKNMALSTLVLLTTNFNLETVLIMSELYGTSKPQVIDVNIMPVQKAVRHNAPRMLKSQQTDIIAQLMAAAKMEREGANAKKRAKYNLADQLCKSAEWRHRVKYPMPKSVLGAVVDPGCPTSALPTPNVVLNRLLQIVTVKHQRQK